MPSLSVVIPATDRPATLADAVLAVEAALAAEDELIVVTEPAGANAAEARNAGVRRASGEVLVFVDSDVLIHPGALARIRAAMAADPYLTAVFGSYDDTPAAGMLVSDFRNLLHHHVHQSAGGPAETFWTGLGAVRRPAFDGVGGFDERMRWIQDIDLGMRMSASGARIELDPALLGTHLKRWSLRTMLWTDFRRRGVSWVALMVRRRRVPSGLNLGWRHRLSAVLSLVGLIALLRGRVVGVVGALVGLVALNAPFYRLLLRRLGAAGALAGVGLHALHHLASVAAVPAGVAAAARAHLADRPR